MASVWNLDSDAALWDAARERLKAHGIPNATLIAGSGNDPGVVGLLPDAHFDLVLSRRGPGVNHTLLPKLAPDARVIQELWLDPPGLLEIFGRKSALVDVGNNPRWLMDTYACLDLRAVSFKEYYFDLYFADADHLARYLSLPTQLLSYPMPAMPYDDALDRQALELYVRYNEKRKGVHVIGRRMAGLFRREPVQYAPARPDVEPME